MDNTEGLELKMTDAACNDAAYYRLTPDVLKSVFSSPVVISPRKKEGQFQISANGVNIVGYPRKDSFLATSLYVTKARDND